jgi:hypothetical protein
LYEELRPDDVDPLTLTWWLHRAVDPEKTPPGRTVIEFRYTAPERQTLWIVIDAREVSVCIRHPGFEPDVVVTATTSALGEVFAGHCTWSAALVSGSVRIDGAPRLANALPRWFQPSPFHADIRRRARRSRQTPPQPHGSLARSPGERQSHYT